MEERIIKQQEDVKTHRLVYSYSTEIILYEIDESFEDASFHGPFFSSSSVLDCAYFINEPESAKNDIERSDFTDSDINTINASQVHNKVRPFYIKRHRSTKPRRISRASSKATSKGTSVSCDSEITELSKSQYDIQSKPCCVCIIV